MKLIIVFLLAVPTVLFASNCEERIALLLEKGAVKHEITLFKRSPFQLGKYIEVNQILVFFEGTYLNIFQNSELSWIENRENDQIICE